MISIAEKQRELTRLFKATSDSPAVDAEILIAHVTQKTKTQLIVESSTLLTKGEDTVLNELAKQRCEGKPIAYLTGTKSFWTMDLKVTQDTLIPRPDTESLVQWILDNFSKDKKLKVADLGTGTGAIAIALALECPNWTINATDINPNTLDIAKQNAEKYSLKNICFYHGDWFDALPCDDYDIIVSNPPYIEEGDIHLKQLNFEPIAALTSGKDGLDAIKKISSNAKNYLNPKGTLIIEHGYNQQENVLSLFKNSVFSATGYKDLAEQHRFVVAKKRVGILLINLGTPENPDVKSVRKYFKDFLLDPYVITLPAIARYFLVYAFILPFRPKNSAHAYQQIWTKQGSPLLVNSENLKNSLSKNLGDEYHVALGMRYGEPSIKDAIEELNKNNCEHHIVLPLFPQYAKATTQSAIDAYLKHKDNSYEIIHDFYNQPAFINAYAELIKLHLEKLPDSFLLFSYHGLPERQIDSKTCINKHKCKSSDACPINNTSTDCYRAQCFATTNYIAKNLNLSNDKYQTTFQSRLGKAKWIEPYTDKEIIRLREQGVENLIIACPSFVSDCLETLEEINIRLKDQWITLGGKNFITVPCLNDNKTWVKELGAWLKKISK